MGCKNGVLLFFPNENPYGITLIPVGNNVRLNYKFIVFQHPCGMHLKLTEYELTNLTPIKSLRKQFLVMLTKHPIFRLDELRIVGQEFDGRLTNLRD